MSDARRLHSEPSSPHGAKGDTHGRHIRRRDTASDTRSDRTLTSYPVGQGEYNFPPPVGFPPKSFPPAGSHHFGREPSARAHKSRRRRSAPRRVMPLAAMRPARRANSGRAAAYFVSLRAALQRSAPAQPPLRTGERRAARTARKAPHGTFGGVILRQTHAPQAVGISVFPPEARRDAFSGGLPDAYDSGRESR